MATYTRKKKKKKKDRMKKNTGDPLLVVDLDKALSSGGTPANPGFGRKAFTGITGPGDDHVHRYSLDIDNGVINGFTDEVDGHTHDISGQTGGQLEIRINTSAGIPTVRNQFVEAQGNDAGGRPTVEREGNVHTHSVSFSMA